MTEQPLIKISAVVIIPARLQSTRLPRKVLLDIAGKPMLQHVCERASQAHLPSAVLVATDSQVVVDAVSGWGFRAILTDPNLPSGTARIASIIDRVHADIVVNVQGDQPFVEPDLIDDLVQSFSSADVDIVTPVWRITHVADLTDAGIAKVVRAHDGRALYFSRSPIPFVRDADMSEWPESITFWGHYGVYGFRRKVLLDFSVSLPAGLLTQAEKLEQLAFLEAGYQIHTIETKYRQMAVDTAEDLERVRQVILRRLRGH